MNHSETRKIKLEVMDPCGMPTEEAIEMSYYNMGYETPPEEHPPVIVGDMSIEWVPMKTARYLLTIGEHKYWMNRKGEIIEHITEKF